MVIAEELREALADSGRTALPMRASVSRLQSSTQPPHDAAYARLEACKA